MKSAMVISAEGTSGAKGVLLQSTFILPSMPSSPCLLPSPHRCTACSEAPACCTFCKSLFQYLQVDKLRLGDMKLSAQKHNQQVTEPTRQYDYGWGASPPPPRFTACQPHTSQKLWNLWIHFCFGQFGPWSQAQMLYPHLLSSVVHSAIVPVFLTSSWATQGLLVVIGIILLHCGKLLMGIRELTGGGKEEWLISPPSSQEGNQGHGSDGEDEANGNIILLPFP